MSRAPFYLSVVGTLLIAACAFVLSFSALADLAHIRGVVDPHQAWMIPLTIDATVLVSTLATVTLAGQPGRWYAWALLVTFAALSVAGNIAHAIDGGAVAIVIAAVPPIAMLALVELTVVLTAPRERTETEGAPAVDARARALELIDEGELSQRAIATVVGVSESTVRRWRDAALAA